MRPASAGEGRHLAVWWRHGHRRRALLPRCCLGLEWDDPLRTAGKMDKPLRCRPLEGRRDQRSPLRRCFKPRPPLSAGCAGFASGCRLSGSELKRPMLSPLGLESLGFESRPHSGRLSGLLSGCPPTGTRPQARAKLGNCELIALNSRCKSFLALARNFFSRARRNGYASVAAAILERLACLLRRRATLIVEAPSDAQCGAA